MTIKDQTSNIRDQTSEIKHQIRDQTSNIKHQTSNIKHQTSNIKHQTSNIKHQTSNIKHQTSNIRHQRSEIRREKGEDLAVRKLVDRKLLEKRLCDDNTSGLLDAEERELIAHVLLDPFRGLRIGNGLKPCRSRSANGSESPGESESVSECKLV